MKKHLIFLFLILFIQGFSDWSSLSGKENYVFRTFSPEGGFYYDGVRDIQQDKDGFIWVLMENDLYRFDGYQYRHYSSSFRELDRSVRWRFTGIAADSLGRFFVSSNNGLYSYDRNSDSFRKVIGSQLDYVKIDNRNNVWVKNNSRIGILDVENASIMKPLYDGDSLLYIGNVFCPYSSDLYVFSNYGKIYRFDYSNKEFSLSFTMPEKDGLIQGAKVYKGKLWVLVDKYGLYKIDLRTFTIEERFDLVNITGKKVPARTMYIDKNGHIWIGTLEGLYILNTTTKQYSHFLHSKSDPFSLTNNSIWTISEDQQKNVWIGGYSGSVCYVNINERAAFKSYSPQEGQLNHAPVSSFAEDENYVWIGTEGGGVNRLNKVDDHFTYYSNTTNVNSPAHNNIKSLVIDKNKNLWISMFRGGLDCFDIQKNTFRHYRPDTNNKNSILSNDLRKIVLESDSGLWIVYQLPRLVVSFLSFKDYSFSHYYFGEDDSSYFIYDVLRGRDNSLWFACHKKLYKMDIKERTFKEVHLKDSLYLNAHSLCNGDLGEIWIGTIGNGLIKYDPEKETCKIFDDILKFNVSSIYGICYDDDGDLWMGTDNGLFKYNIESNKFFQFDKKDGIQGQVYYPLSAMKGASGELYFGGTNGFTVVNPKNITFNTYKPRVVISEFFIDNKPVKANYDDQSSGISGDWKSEIVLNYDQSNFGFKFSSDNYLIPEKNHFKYRLRGYDDRWIEVDASNRTALYSKVPAGTYYFEVLAANNDGVWSDIPTVIKVKRESAPWLSAPAYLLYLIIILTISGIILRYYNEKKKLKLQLYLENIEKDKKEQIHQAQLRFFTNISHDFRTPLSLIIAALDKLRQEGLKEYYYRILNGNSQRLLNLVNELMDFRTVENGKMKLEVQAVDVNSFVREVASDFIDYAVQRNIDFKIICDPELIVPLFVDKYIVEKVVMNLLNNAFKYTKNGGSVVIETYSKKSSFQPLYKDSYVVSGDYIPTEVFSIVVKDSGIGISKESISSVFERFYKVKTVNMDSHLGTGIGLALVKSLVLLHKGVITIFSEREKGTEMEVCLSSNKETYKENEFLKDKEEVQEEILIESEGADVLQADEILEDTVLLRNKKRILLAEDNDDLRILIADSLSEEYDVVQAADGLAASELADDMDVDLIISDIMMPLKDGVTFCAEIKSNINTSHIPFILLTAKTGLESKIEGADSGADIYFEKPIDLNFLKLSLQNIFKHQQQLKEYYAKNYFADSSELSSNEQDNKFLKKFIEIIEDNIDQSDMDVNYIASELSMSRSKLYTKIKTLTDKSIVEFILSHRLRKAARLIIEENMTMREIMVQIGIESQPYFTNAFKKEFGETPTAFASKHKKNKQK